MANYCLFVSLFFICSFECRGQDAGKILDEYLLSASAGNLSNWDTIKSAYIESKGFYKTDDNGFKEDKTTYSRVYRVWPDKLRTEVYEDSTFTKLLMYSLWLGKKQKLIHWFPYSQPSIVPIEEVKWDFDPVVINQMKKKATSIKYLGEYTIAAEDLTCDVIQSKTKDDTLNLGFNKSSGKLEFGSPTDYDKNMARYMNYIRINGLSFYLTSTAFRNGNIMFYNHITRIEFNRKFDEKLFDDPTIKR